MTSCMATFCFAKKIGSFEVTMMNMLVGVLVEVIKTVSEIEREQHLGFGIFGFGFKYFF